MGHVPFREAMAGQVGTRGREMASHVANGEGDRTMNWDLWNGFNECHFNE
jgi:hypothetical protein